MNITLIYLGRKGAGPVYSIKMANALLLNNKILAIVSSNSKNIESWRMLSKSYSNMDLYEIKTYSSLMSFFINSFKINTFLNIRNKITSFKSDFVYSTMMHPWNFIIFSILPKRLIKIRTMHDAVPHIGENNIFMRFLLRQECKADYIITLTQAVSMQLQELGVPKNKIVKIPHANMDYYNQKQSNKDFRVNNRIGFFGRINEYKGLKYLCDAFALVVAENSNFKLLIAGRGNVDKFQPFFGEYAKYLDLHIGWIDDDKVADLIQSVDLIVLPYIEASQSGVIPLAFSFGKPVIVSDVGGLSEQVPSDCGIVVSPKDIIGLKTAILSLYQDISLMRKMGIAAKNYADTILAWEHSANILTSLIQTK